MQGRRLPDNYSAGPNFTWDSVKPGDYFKQDKGRWFVMAPSGESGSVSPPTWTITENHDGTITVDPSIFFNRERNGWHGFLENGKWRHV